MIQVQVPSSKSLLNRALIIQSFNPEAQIKAISEADDVQKLALALSDFQNQKTTFDCGGGGTTFRFLALRASRSPGTYLLKTSEALRNRPSQDLMELLKQFGVHSYWSELGFHMESQGWRPSQEWIQVSQHTSSQYLSALLLSSWRLDFDLKIQRIGDTSDSYSQMTKNLVEHFGMSLFEDGDQIQIQKSQKPKSIMYEVEPDLSSAFSVAALGIVKKGIILSGIPRASLQPDFEFVDILKAMGGRLQYTNLQDGTVDLEIHPSDLHGVDVSLHDTPDLFPVLAALCAVADGPSRLSGAPQLMFKESHRIKKISELFQLLNIDHEDLEDGMVIGGQNRRNVDGAIQFHSADDHRIAMAVGVLQLAGFNIRLTDPQAVKKSFPEYWQVWDSLK